jgi:hypothetical protein
VFTLLLVLCCNFGSSFQVSRLLSGLCCLIFSVLCNALSTIVFLFVLFIQLLYCLFFYDFKLLIIPLVSSKNFESPIMHVGLVQSIHHHLIEFQLIHPTIFSWKIATIAHYHSSKSDHEQKSHLKSSQTCPCCHLY